jgi:phage shock protein PspC (stress-responsive transcriptional regulator)
MVAGVCEGLARYFDVNPALYRVGFVVLTLLGGAGIVIYLAAVLVIPEEGRQDSIAADTLRARQDRPWALVGLGLVAVAGAVLLSRASLWPQGDAAWVLALIAGGVILLAQRSRGSARGEAVTVEGEPVEAVRASHVMRNVSIVLAAIVVSILVAAAAVASVFHVNVGDGVGDRTYVAAGATDVQRDYRLGVGSLRVDLSGVPLPVGETSVRARVGIGELRVVVPAGVALRVNATSRAGEVHVLGLSDDGRNAAIRVNDQGLRVLVLDARVGLGKVDVVRAPLTP